MLLAGVEMVGNFLVFFAMMLFARHVVLDAEGLLPHREEEEEDEDEELEGSETSSLGGDQWRKVDSPHPTPQPVFQRVEPKPAATPTSAVISSPINRKLTKGEKKALKERLLRERRERERHGV